ESDARRKLDYDLYYVKNNNILFDISILLQTAEVVLLGQGAADGSRRPVRQPDGLPSDSPPGNRDGALADPSSGGLQTDTLHAEVRRG
ncbi:MAG: hypothetical protein ABIP38_14770, partial [Steroidobacteraceae bacterium]